MAGSSSRTPPTSRPTPSRPVSGIVNHTVYTDPQEDLVREQARMLEATPGGPSIAQYTNSSPPSGTRHASNGSASAPRSGKRQDFSNEKFSKKDNRLGDYFLGKTLGAGEFAKVRIGWKMEGGVEVAVKMISKSGLDNRARLDKVEREIAILKAVNHPNIIKMHEIVETTRIIGIVMEYASRGELFEYIARERYLKDGAARRLFAQLVSGVGYLHRKGIIHRDLKLENLLLDRNHNLIVTDFGFANTFDPHDELGERVESNLHRRSFIKKYDLEALQSNGFRRGDLMATSCGSPCYAAPELVVSDTIYTGRKVDVWSCGVILYAMLAGYLPFDDDPSNPDGDNINLLYKYIVSAPLVFPEHVTPHARDLLRRILVPDPRLRADLFEVARHSWLSEYAHVVEGITSASPVASAVSKMAVSDGYGLPPPLVRSNSVREATRIGNTASPVGGLTSKHGKNQIVQDPERRPTPRDQKRRTVQLEYVAPQSQTPRPDGAEAASSSYNFAPTASQYPPGTRISSDTQTQRTRTPADGPSTKTPARKPLPSASAKAAAAAAVAGAGARSIRDPLRSASDTNAMASTPSLSLYSTMPTTTSRPPTQGSMTGTSRLPQRGSYGLPSAATVATTNVQGRISQPPPTRGKMDSFSGSPVEAEPQPQTQPRPVQDSEDRQRKRSSQVYSPTESTKQKRNSTFGSLGDRLFGRSNSRTRNEEKRRSVNLSQQQQQPQQQQTQQQYYEVGQNGSWTLAQQQPPQAPTSPLTQAPQNSRRSKTERGPAAPPSSYRPVKTEAEEPAAPRKSTESTRRSFGFSRKSIDMPTREKRSSRRFSFIPRLGSSHGKEQGQEQRQPTSEFAGAAYTPGEPTVNHEEQGRFTQVPSAQGQTQNDATRDGTFDMDARSRYEQFGQTYDHRDALPVQPVQSIQRMSMQRGEERERESRIPVPVANINRTGESQAIPVRVSSRTADSQVAQGSSRTHDAQAQQAQQPRSRANKEHRSSKRFSGVPTAWKGDVGAVGSGSASAVAGSGAGAKTDVKAPERKGSTTSRVIGFLRGRRASQAI